MGVSGGEGGAGSREQPAWVSHTQGRECLPKLVLH